MYLRLVGLKPQNILVRQTTASEIYTSLQALFIFSMQSGCVLVLTKYLCLAQDLEWLDVF